MNKLLYLLILLLLPFFAGIAIAKFELDESYFQILFVFIVPVLIYLRMKYLKYSFSEMLKSLIPFAGLKYRIKRFFE